MEIGRLMENADRQSQDIEASNGSSSKSGAAYPVNRLYKSIKRNYPARQSPSVKSQVKSCYRCGRAGHLANDYTVTKGKKCNNCQKVGHFAKMCETKSQRSGKINVVAHEELEDHNTNIEEARNLNVCDDDSSSDEYIFYVGNNQKDKFELKVNDCPVKMLIDSGTTVNLLDSAAFDNLLNKPFVKKLNTKIFPYVSTTPLKLRGSFYSKLTHKDRSIDAKFYVVEGNYGSLLRKDSATRIDLLRIGPENSFPLNTSSTPNTVEGIVSKHLSVFSGVGKLKNFQVKIHIDPTVTPVIQPLKRLPYHTRAKVSEELDRLLKLNIIEPAEGHSRWINPVVVVPKSSGEIRLCLDMRRPNEAIIRERFPIPTLDEVIQGMHRAKVFSKLDLKEGYYQLELEEHSREITTFSTHKGLFRYKRLIFGMNTAFKVF